MVPLLVSARACIGVGVAAAAGRAVMRPCLGVGLMGHNLSGIGMPLDRAWFRPLRWALVLSRRSGATFPPFIRAGRVGRCLARIVVASGRHQPVIMYVVLVLSLLCHCFTLLTHARALDRTHAASAYAQVHHHLRMSQHQHIPSLLSLNLLPGE